MLQYIEQISVFLRRLHNTIGILDQRDFPRPNLMMDDSNSSTEKEPLKYFDFLFTKNGLDSIKSRFFADASDVLQDLILKTDTKNEFIIYHERDSLTGEWVDHKNTFDDFYKRQLTYQYSYSKKLIDDKINILPDPTSISTFITLTFDKLNYFRYEIQSNPKVSRYPLSLKTIELLYEYIKMKYPSFINDFYLI
jgi:hypothetical protein